MLSRVFVMMWCTALAACQCGRTNLNSRFACTIDADCMTDEVCIQRECFPVDAGIDAGATERDAGSLVDAGRPVVDAGQPPAKRVFTCQQAIRGYDCGNGRDSANVLEYTLSEALVSCAAWVMSDRDFCGVRTTMSNSNDRVDCTASGRTWVTTGNCCVNMECRVGQWGDGSTPCAVCTNKPLNATAVTYATSGCGSNSCDYAMVTCNGGFTWNGETSVSGARCQ